MLDIFLLGIQTIKNFPENTNAPPTLPIGNASALRASRVAHNNAFVLAVTYLYLVLLFSGEEFNGDPSHFTFNQGLSRVKCKKEIYLKSVL